MTPNTAKAAFESRPRENHVPPRSVPAELDDSQTKNRRTPRMAWRYAIKDDKALSHWAFSLAQTLDLYGNVKLGPFIAWPSIKRLAEDMRCSERQVKRALSELRSAGYITSKQRGFNESNLYTMTLPKTITEMISDDGVMEVEGVPGRTRVVAVPVQSEVSVSHQGGDCQSPGGGLTGPLTRKRNTQEEHTREVLREVDVVFNPVKASLEPELASGVGQHQVGKSRTPQRNESGGKITAGILPQPTSPQERPREVDLSKFSPGGRRRYLERKAQEAHEAATPW